MNKVELYVAAQLTTLAFVGVLSKGTAFSEDSTKPVYLQRDHSLYAVIPRQEWKEVLEQAAKDQGLENLCISNYKGTNQKNKILGFTPFYRRKV